MIENTNSSYETLIKRLQQIWQQSQANKESIQNSQPDNSKIFLEPNWIQSIGIINDTRSSDGNDQPVVPIVYTTLLQNIITVTPSFIPINSNIDSGLMPMTVSYSYKEILPNITKDIIPFLEYQTSFSVPTGNMKLSGGFVWNLDFWASEYVITANSVIIWDGFFPPLASDIEVSQYQVDNEYPTYSQQSWGLSFTSSTGGIYGHGATVGVVLINIYDETADVFIPITEDVISTFNPTHSYQFQVWSNDNQLGYTLQYSLMTTATITIHTGAYICFWSSTMDLTNIFYIYENIISAGDIIFELFPPAINEPLNDLNPINFTINEDGPTKYSDVINNSASVYVNPNPSYDPFYIRQSKSTDINESWQSNIVFGGIVTTPGIKTTGIELEQYNDTYTWGLVGGTYQWTLTYNHTILEGDQYLPVASDMTARVRVAVRPIINWKKTDKYQL